jgi:integrase
MARTSPRYLVARPRKAGQSYYWLPTKKLQAAGFLPRRLPDELAAAVAAAEQHNARLDAWYRGESLTPAPRFRSDSLNALCELFQEDDAFRGLAPRSQRDFLYSIKPAIVMADGLPVAAITRKVAKGLYRDLRDKRGPAAARNTTAALRRLLSFALDEKWISVNPALQLRLRSPGTRKRVWSPLELEAFTAAAEAAGRPSMALAVLLGWCLGQRPADLRTLTWSAYDGRAVALRQAKTQTEIWVPCLPQLRRLLDATPRQAVQIVISENTGRPYGESDFQHTFAELRAAAGLAEDLQYRDLRRTLATALGAAGCTDDQIRSVTGHKTREVVGVYVRPDRTFAEGAIRRLQRATKGGDREQKPKQS